MTLNGYYFTATGITEYAFFHGDRELLRVSHDSLPDAPARITAATGKVYTLVIPYAWGEAPYDEAPEAGATFPFLDPDGAQAGGLYLLGADHFAVAVPGVALNGRVIHEHLHRSVFLTALDDEPIARVEYSLERILSRERFGEWFPRRYAADVMKQPNETLLSLALAAPFLGFNGLEVR